MASTQNRLGLVGDIILNGGTHLNRSPLGRDFYVMTAAQQAKMTGDLKKRTFLTVNAAFNACEATRGDKIFVAEGYTEVIHIANQWSNVKAGVRVIGCGTGTSRPKFTWDATAATLLLTAANVTIENCQFELAGDPAASVALTTALGISITGVGCKLLGNHFQVGVDADQIITLGVLVNATKVEIGMNTFIGATAAEITAAGTVLRLTAADQVSIHDNYFSAALATDTDGLIETLTTASIDISVVNNYWYSNGSGSTCGMDFGQSLACTGFIDWNQITVDADGTAQTVAFTVSATNNLTLGQNNFFVSNNNERGLIIGTATT